MRAVILASAEQKAELGNGFQQETGELIWVDTVEALAQTEAADLRIDLLFENTAGRRAMLQQNQPGIIVVNSVIDTTAELGPDFVRLNAWPGFLERVCVEAASQTEAPSAAVVRFFEGFGKRVVWTPDEPGFITARVIAMIINEAYLAWGEGVSSKEEIDTAMKLGTNYPMGPFAWAARIGINNVYALLQRRAARDEKYKPAPALEKEMVS